MDALPIDAILPDLLAALRGPGAAVVTAPPGAGKSTRVPPAILTAPDLLDAAHPRVLLLQPRRMAAMALAERIAAERGWELGREVGYRVRFERVGGEATLLWVETEGTLTRGLLSDPYLEGVGAVVIDEFHERSVHADLALAWVAELRRVMRPDLRMVVMSATMETGTVSAFLDEVPVVSAPEVPHRVAVHHRPGRPREGLPARVVRVLSEALDADAGDALAFLPGAGEIAACARRLDDRDDLAVLPLHGSLPPASQRRALEPTAARKVVLATNVAETSLTIPGIRVVVDGGLARVARYDPEIGLDLLRLEPISTFSADQRAGRAGRDADGRCYRCWSRLEERRRPAATDPELHRCDLAGVLPIIKALHGADSAAFPWFEPPPAERLEAAEALLARLGYTDGPGEALNARGRYLVGLSLHPRLGRLLADAAAAGGLELGLEVAALLAERDLRPPNDRAGATPESADLVDRRRCLDRARRAGFHRRLREEGIDPSAARRVDAAVAQLRGQARRLFGELPRRPVDPERLLPRLLVAAFPDRIAARRGGNPNRLAIVGGGGADIPPGSCLYARPGTERPGLVVAHAVQGFGGRARRRRLLRLGVDLDRGLLEELAPGAIRREESLRYVPERGRVEAAAVDRYEDLVIAYRPGIAADPEAVADCLAEGLEPEWAQILAAHPAAASLLRRWTWLQEHAPDAGLPIWDADAIREVLLAVCAGRRNRDQVMAANLLPWIESRLSWEQRQRLEAWAPERIAVPSGSRLRIDYTEDRPILAVRIQELFGLAETPRIAGGRIAVLLHLLAPNRRSVQVTDDLASFWANTYPGVRRELRGRYPKHAWPEI